jgi:phosphoribosylformylglycinamidine (FGAM) synthase-like enzyme
MDEQSAIIKYSFYWSQWIAVYEQNTNIFGCGDTPADAVENLKFQLNKHDLWIGERPVPV